MLKDAHTAVENIAESEMSKHPIEFIKNEALAGVLPSSGAATSSKQRPFSMKEQQRPNKVNIDMP